MCSASATAEQNQSEAKIDAAPFLRCVGRLIHRYFFLKHLSADISEKKNASRQRVRRIQDVRLPPPFEPLTMLAVIVSSGLDLSGRIGTKQ
jgi:hypothetical protein